MSHGSKNHRIWPELGVSRLYLQLEFTDGYEMMHRAWSSIVEVPYCFSRSSVKCQGHTALKIVKFDPNWAFPDWNSHFEFSNGYEMLHTAWNSKGEMPYCFPRSSVKFQGHTTQNITDFDPNWAFPNYRPVAAFKSLRFALLPLSAPSWRGIVVTVQAGGRVGGCQTCGTHISVTAWRIFSIRNSVELSRPLVVHCHGHLPICPIWVCPWAKNVTNQAALGPDFAEPISLKPLDGLIPFEVLWNCLDL